MSTSGKIARIAPSDTIMGSALLLYGHSYLAYTGNSEVLYPDLLRASLTPWLFENYGNAGMLMDDITSGMFGTATATRQGSASSAHSPTTIAATFGSSALLGGLVIIDGVRNSAGLDGTTTSGGTTAKSRAGFANSLHSAICKARSGVTVSSVPSGNVVYTGTWTPNTVSTACTAGKTAFTSTNGDKVTVTLTMPSAGAAQLVVLGLDDSALAETGAAFTVTVDAGPVINGTTSNQARKTGHTPSNASFCQLSVDLGVLGAGAHTIVLTHNDTTGKFLWFDSVMGSTPTPPTVAVLKSAQLNAAGYALSYPGVGAGPATDAIYHGLVDAEVALYPNTGTSLAEVISIDPNTPAWNPNTMIGNADGFQVHMNNAGNAYYYALIMAALNKLAPRQGLVRI